MTPVVNIAAYRFAPLENRVELRVELRQLCESLSLKGTILLSPEGINVFLAGSREAIDALIARVRAIPGYAEIECKESLSPTQPFDKLRVRLKKEIIAFSVDGIDPLTYTSRRLPAAELKRWLDEGKPVILLDTRNDYEIEAGTFRDALTLPLDDFRNFPKRIAELGADLKSRPIVTFCTGGIRCEKAAPYLESVGFTDVYQLEGGILKYFELCGGAHYDGACFVFDQRGSLDPSLTPVSPASDS